MPAATLQPGLRHEFSYRVPPDKTVPPAKFSARAAAKVPGTAS